jgi:hypothetical protein
MIFCEILTLQALIDFEKYKTRVPRIGNIQGIWIVLFCRWTTRG